MKAVTFKGGVHPWDGKKLAKDVPVRALTPGQELVFPMSQHIGAPAVPCVKKGDPVLKGQRIGEAAGFMSVNVHSSVSGKVKAVEERLTAGGAKVLSVVVTNDGACEEAPPLETAETGEKEIIRDLICQAGVVGMGGATFPVHVKLTPKDDDAIEYVILNGAECEPYLTTDYRRMLDDAESIVRGLEIMLKLFARAKGIIAIEDNKPDCIERMEEAAKGHERIQVIPLKTKYPQGGERALIFAVTGRKINSDMLPADVGCIVNNVNTAYEVYRAVDERKPSTERLFTVTGDAAAAPGNFLVPLGMSHQEVADQAGGFNCEPEKLISGGPMMGIAMYTLDVPVTKGSGSILAYREDPVRKAERQKTNCINCGRCVEVCPGRVIPSRLADFALQKNRAMFEKYYGMECCECGCCSFICPAKRDLTQSIKTYRREILALRRAERAKK